MHQDRGFCLTTSHTDECTNTSVQSPICARSPGKKGAEQSLKVALTTDHFLKQPSRMSATPPCVQNRASATIWLLMKQRRSRSAQNRPKKGRKGDLHSAARGPTSDHAFKRPLKPSARVCASTLKDTLTQWVELTGVVRALALSLFKVLLSN